MTIPLSPLMAARRLGLSLEGLTLQAVQDAFRAKAFSSHPDAGNKPGAYTLAQLREAKTVLTEYLKSRA